MRSIVMVTAIAGAIWYAAPQVHEAATLQAATQDQEGDPVRWRLSGTGLEPGACYLRMTERDGAGELVKSPECADTAFPQAARWWEDSGGNIVLASAEGERLAEFALDETEGLVSVWPSHTILTLTPAN
jgi:hypothetical protein